MRELLEQTIPLEEQQPLQADNELCNFTDRARNVAHTALESVRGHGRELAAVACGALAMSGGIAEASDSLPRGTLVDPAYLSSPFGGFSDGDAELCLVTNKYGKNEGTNRRGFISELKVTPKIESKTVGVSMKLEDYQFWLSDGSRFEYSCFAATNTHAEVQAVKRVHGKTKPVGEPIVVNYTKPGYTGRQDNTYEKHSVKVLLPQKHVSNSKYGIRTTVVSACKSDYIPQCEDGKNTQNSAAVPPSRRNLSVRRKIETVWLGPIAKGSKN